MEIVERKSRSATVPLALILAVLVALVIGLGAWNAAHRPAVIRLQTPSAAATSLRLSPDAEQRNEEIRADQLDAAQATHGR